MLARRQRTWISPYIVGRDIKWYSNSRKQFSKFFKKKTKTIHTIAIDPSIIILGRKVKIYASTQINYD